MAFTCEQRVDWGDCDEAGLVFYPNYFRWMDAAFHRFCAAAGHSQHSLREAFDVFGTPLIDASCGFAAPATHGEALQIEVHVTRWGDSSLSLEYRFSRNGQAIARGSESRVFVQRIDGRLHKTRIPATFRSSIQALDHNA